MWGEEHFRQRKRLVQMPLRYGRGWSSEGTEAQHGWKLSKRRREMRIRPGDTGQVVQGPGG